ncbi:NrdG Organic radical activating enzymes [uncultured Caudovirales phage]|uniref:NrdG Organic radical activating enzymes n=1 Tax=uncultured Caudovirales phage TaxID=2100421 RepID=A0A6J5LZN0_9CAUD|nr:NrdG Organic radical activating enzymes [uncultured Caudovirales phage]
MSEQARRYTINEMFYSLQGEGARAGRPSVFVRFTGCNLRCRVEPGEKSPGGFDCDTEFASGRSMSLEEVVAAIRAEHAGMTEGSGQVPQIVFTGGEPALQLDRPLIDACKSLGYFICIETNGSIELPRSDFGAKSNVGEIESIADALACYAVDWITVSPKVAEHAIRQKVAHEVKYVRGRGQSIPKPACRSLVRLISPTFNGLCSDSEAIKTVHQLALRNPGWGVSVQMHKLWNVR